MRILTFILPILAFGAIERNPAGCSSRPCTYTLTCEAPICTTAESAELQTVLNEAHLGDTIRLQAGRTWTGTSSNFSVTGRPGSGWLTITTTLEDRLPSSGSRITPHYRGVMPTIRNASNSPRALSFPGNITNPARYIRIIGVRFDAQAGAQGLIWIGDGTSDPWNRDPSDLVIDRCIVENSQWLTTVGTLIGYRGHRIWIINSYLQGSIKKPGAEVQIISRTWGETHILNNYIAENMGENIMYGGTDPDVDQEPYNTVSGEIAYNVLINHRERVPHLEWQPNTRYFKSVTVRYGGQNYIATNSGTSGSTFTTYDNGIQWTTFSGKPSSKNVFELKNAKDLKIHHNTFEGFWTQAQYQLIIFKVTNRSVWPVDCKPYYAGTCDVNGDVVTSNDPLPYLWFGGYTDGSAGDIVINGTTYRIKNFDLTNPNRVYLTASAGTMTNVPFEFRDAGWSGICKGAYFRNVAFEYNVVRKGPAALNMLAFGNSRFERIGNIRVRNNLMYDIDRNKYCMAEADCDLSKGTFYFSQLVPGVDFSNNTIVDVDNIPNGMIWEGWYGCRGWNMSIEPCVRSGSGYYFPSAGDTRVANNIIPRGSSQMLQGFTPWETGSAVLANKICEGGCTKEKWDGNILVGASISGYPSGTYNLCPSTSSCTINYDYDDPVQGKLFRDYPRYNLKVRPLHYAARNGMYGRQIGADWDSLPIITKVSDGTMGPDVYKTQNTITLVYKVTAPQRHIPCTVEASTTPDIEGGRLMDLDAATYLRPDIDGPPNSITRSVTIGSRTPLSPSTNYYLRLHCGGAFWEGEVRTND